MRKLYTSEGYIDLIMIPNTSFTGSGVHMNVEIREGPQYHMGKMDVIAKKELAERLREAHAHLADHARELDRLVQSRTAKLAESNQQLRHEIKVREEAGAGGRRGSRRRSGISVLENRNMNASTR